MLLKRISALVLATLAAVCLVVPLSGRSLQEYIPQKKSNDNTPNTFHNIVPLVFFIP
jgi:hypothetical protein